VHAEREILAVLQWWYVAPVDVEFGQVENSRGRIVGREASTVNPCGIIDVSMEDESMRL
jgi:hypothetical protein